MKILHVNWTGDLGGAENVAFQLARFQKSCGHDVAIGYMSKQTVFGELAVKAGIDVFEGNMKNGYDFMNFCRFIRVINRKKFDIIHNHNGTPLFNVAKIFFPASIIVNHFHGTRFGNERWNKKEVLLWNTMTYGLFDHHVACSYHTREAVVNRYGIQAHKVAVLYNGIDLDRFRPTKEKNSVRREFGLKDTDKIVGIVSNLRPQKGVDKFIEVAARVARENDRITFFVVGDGVLRAALESKAALLTVKNRIVFTGLRTDIPNLLSIFDIFALTSKWEPFGIVLLEAMAIGVPIVAFSVDGVTEVVDATCAVLIQPQNVTAMSKAVLELLDNKQRQLQLSESGFRRVKRFDIRNTSQVVTKLYDALKASKHTGMTRSV